MSTFATEFPAKPGLTKAKFGAAVIAWVRGIVKSTVLDAYDAQELYEEYNLEVFTKNIDMSDIDLKGILLENAEEIFERYFKRIKL